VLSMAALVMAASAYGATPSDEQIIKYYRKKANVPPAQKVTVTGLKDSAIKGAKEGTLEIGDGPGAKKIPFTMSADGRYVVFAATEDVTVDPSKAVMQKINLKGHPFKGPATAKVTIVEWSDFQCPFCSRAYNTVENQVLKEYGDKVKLYFKHYPLPFHPWAEPSAVAAECAKLQDPDAFWKLYKGYFEQQAQINMDNLKQKTTEMLAGTKVDMAKFNDCFDNKKTAAEVKAQMAEGSSVGISGTPGFIINGRLVSGAQPFENFKNIIDDELASSK
jgi:protein-disulfide isomerase